MQGCAYSPMQPTFRKIMSISGHELYSEAEWEHLRARFTNSELAEMELTALAQNAGCSWPFKGSDETPAKYTGLTLEELHAFPGLIGKKSRVRTLFDILRETLAFDDPFTVMADYVESECKIDDSIERSLAKLSIDLAFPLSLAHFQEGTVVKIRERNLQTLRELVDMGQKQEIYEQLDGELRAFLTALSNKDETMIARFLPYRAGGRGLHLAESIAQEVRRMAAPAMQLLKVEAGVEEAEGGSVDEAQQRERLQPSLDFLERACQWFAEEATTLRSLMVEGGEPVRFFLTLNDPKLERLCVQLSIHYFGVARGQKSGGLLGRFLGR